MHSLDCVWCKWQIVGMLYIPPANLRYLLTVLFYLFIYFLNASKQTETFSQFFFFLFLLNPGQTPNIMFPKVD